MKTALITTTIQVPVVLKLLRAYESDVRFFIAGDENSSEECVNFCTHDLENAEYLFVQDQQQWKCSSIIGWSCIQRRNIALLEALAWGADIIVSHDDDNFPMNSMYFEHFRSVLTYPFNGLQIGGHGWTDSGALAFPREGVDPVVQRGTPQPYFSDQTISTVTNANIGLAQGIILGEPDTSAIDRISRVYPQVHVVSELLREGVALHPKGRAAANTQNTAYLRQFAPAMFCAPGIGRGDDILASLLTQWIMGEMGYQVHFGQPFAFQQRNPHDLVKDLKAEMWLTENHAAITEHLDRMTLGPDVLTTCRYFWGGCEVIPEIARKAALAFLEDVEQVMK